MKTAVLFLNLGGPEKQQDVRSFLYRLFEDPEVIRIKSNILRKFVAFMISTLRYKKSQKMYANIGGGSPIRKFTDLQARETEKHLLAQGYDVVIRTAFTCSVPLVEDIVKDLAQQGITSFLNFPLYPQFSFTTTKGAYDRTRAAVKKFAPEATYIEMESFPIDPHFLDAHVELIKRYIPLFSEPQPEKIHLVFSAHSIPKKLVTEEGDPYEQEMMQTVDGIVKLLRWKGPFTLCWQSKLGPVEWLGPSTEDVIEKIGSEGEKQVLVVPISFVTDHIETLYELDQMTAETAKSAGIREYRRVPGLNIHPLFIFSLAEQIKKKIFPTD